MGNQNTQELKREDSWPELIPLEVREKLRHLQKRFHFSREEIAKLYEIYCSCGGGGIDRPLDRSSFHKALEKLGDCGLTSFRLQETPFGDRLFELYSAPILGFDEFTICLAIVSKGTFEERMDLSFRAYDLDGSGYIQKDELIMIFKSAWLAGLRCLQALGENEQQELGNIDYSDLAEEMAKMFAEEALQALDANGDGVISKEEFKEFALSEPRITVTLAGHQKEFPIIF